MRSLLLAAIVAALACIGCSGELCTDRVIDPHLLNPAAPSQPPGKTCHAL